MRVYTDTDILICLNGLPVTYLRKISSGNGKVYVFEDNPVTLSMADTSCKNAGGTLAMIHSYAEHLLIKSVLDNFPMNIQKYKIGGRKDNNGHWVWNDGRPVHHKYWAPDEPNNAGQKENCLEYFLKGPGYLWNDRTCTDIGGYICQFDACIYEHPQCTNDGKCVRRRLIEDCICSLEQRNQFRFNMDCSLIHLLFAMDTSLSLDNYTEKLVDYTSRSIERLLLKGAGFRIAFLSYNYESTEHLRLGQYQTVETIKEALQNISIESTISPTFTGKALKRGIQILSDSDTYKFIVLMSDGLSTDRKDAIVEAKLFTMSPYHIIICIGVGARVDHLELIQIASRDDSGIYGPLVFPSSTQDSINMIAKLTMRKDCANCNILYASDVIIMQDNTVSKIIFQYSINVATEISKRYLHTHKDVRLGRLSFDQNEFSYYSQDVGFLSLIQKISHAINSSMDIDILLSQARSQFLLTPSRRNKVVVLISEGHWSNVSRVRYEVQELGRQNVTIMIVAISENYDFTHMYEVIQDPFYVFLINDKERWSLIDIIVSQTFKVHCDYL